MVQVPLPYTLEDRTGSPTSTDFDDIYDRAFFHILSAPTPGSSSSSVMIYSMPRRASRARDAHWQAHQHAPAAVLEFPLHGGLDGTVSFFPGGHQRISVAMSAYLRKTSIFGRSLSRKFVCSDGRELKWAHRSVAGQEWTCTTADGSTLIAHYNLKPPDVVEYHVSGNTLTFPEHHAHLAVELLASFVIMRHIQQYNL